MTAKQREIAQLSTDTCRRHSRDFPVWLGCPQCIEEETRMARAAWYAEQVRAGRQEIRESDFLHYMDAEEEEELVITVWDRLLFYAALTVSVSVVGGALWLAWRLL